MNYALLPVLLYAALFLFLYFAVLSRPQEAELRAAEKQKRLFPYLLVLFGIFLIQLCVAGFFPGHKQDMSLFKAWASFGLKHKMSEYYLTELYVDYPPVYLSLLYGIGRIAALFGISPEAELYLVFVKSIPILSDFVFSVFLLLIAKDTLGLPKAGALSILFALNPAILLNSTVWGQADSFVTLLLVAILFLLYQRRYAASCALFALSFLTKPQMLIYAPLLGFTFLADFVELFSDRAARKKMWKQAVCSVLAMAAVFLIVPLPITGTNYGLLVDRYQQAMGLYPYATLNAANLYGAFGKNWAKLDETFFLVSYRTWGFFFVVVMSLLIGVFSFLRKDRKRIFLLGAFTVSTVYLFAHTMHERYLYALIPILFVLFVLTENKKILLLGGAFSLTHFLNVAQVLALNLQDDFIYGDNVPFILLSWVQLILYVLMLVVFFRKNDKKPTEKREKRVREFSLPKQKKTEPIRRLDVVLMLGLTAFYAIFAFWNLGSHHVPENGWYAENAEDSVIVDLGEACDVRQIYAYTGWIDRRHSDYSVKRELTVEVSEDGESWQALDETFSLSSVWHYHVMKTEINARYLRFTPDDGRFYLNELAFYGDNETIRFLPQGAYGTDFEENAAALIDEQEKVVYNFSWYDQAYFDEIYHPRTAYENLTHRYPYENTHPPLGKFIIACGIAIFGMNPFGWRFFGTLCGVLMVPLAYLFGKRMFRSSFFAFCAAFLMSFDFMHLTQTRIATIDSYTVLFVMGMYYFMMRYLERDSLCCGVKKTLPPLLLSGICFGLGAATKWQGIYAGAGLAILFFAKLFYQFCVYQAAKRMEEKTEEAERVIAAFPSLCGKTVCFGALFFLVVPAVIYFLSYIPAMLTPSTGLRFFFINQLSMFQYHSGLTAAHPYGSSWWSWPLDLRPLYAYSPNRDLLPEHLAKGISSFGNPLIWWLTIPVIVGGIVFLVRRTENGDFAEEDRNLFLILCGFLSLYLPWVLIKRVAFIYHFFPCVFFVILGIVYFMKQWVGDHPKRKRYIILYLGAVFVLFVLFYPVLTGITVTKAYAYALRWLPTWVLG